MGSGSGKTNTLSNLLSWETNIDKNDLYAKNTDEAKYQWLIEKRENSGLKQFVNSKVFIEYSDDMADIYTTIKEYSPNRKCKIFIVFHDTIADILGNKELNPIVTELFIRGSKLNISLAFITQSYFAVPKTIGLNSAN